MLEQIRSRLEDILDECKALETELAQPDVPSRSDYIELSQKYAMLKNVAESYTQLKELENSISENETMLKENQDDEMGELIQDELQEQQAEFDQLLNELMASLIPVDPRDARNAIIEIRAGTGGEESALFARDLMRMYERFCEQKGYRVEVLDMNETDLGGFKTVAFTVIGQGAFGTFKYESGVHRVQRVPATETSGRIHTSTATVAVLHEVEEVDVEIRDEDLEIEAFRAGGPGGQNVNKVSSAVRIKHIPTGIVVACQEERSQHKNKAKAMKLLRAKILEQEEAKADKEREKERRIQVGTAARSEKIRTYNFPQNRVTDHRIGFTINNLDRVIEGELDLVLDAIDEAYNEDRLAELVGT